MSNKNLSKNDAMVLLSAHIRNPKLDAELFLKVIALYSRIAGWDKEKTPAPPEQTIDQLVAAVEKKRRQHA